MKCHQGSWSHSMADVENPADFAKRWKDTFPEKASPVEAATETAAAVPEKHTCQCVPMCSGWAAHDQKTRGDGDRPREDSDHS